MKNFKLNAFKKFEFKNQIVILGGDINVSTTSVGDDDIEKDKVILPKHGK